MKTILERLGSNLLRLGWPHPIAAKQSRKIYRAARKIHKAGDHDKALEEYQRALTADPLAKNVEWRMLENGIGAFRGRQAIARWLSPQVKDIVAEAEKWPENPTPPQIYMYWDTGFSNAPQIVQKCLGSLKENHTCPIVELSMDNVQDVAGMPADIYEKLRERQVFLTDVARMYILASRGGIWADATVYFSGSCPTLQELTGDQGFFAFRDIGLKGRISSWFLASEAHSYVARMMAIALTRFWREYDTPPLYHFLHAIFETLYLTDERFAAEFDRSQVLDRMPPHQMQFNMFEKYDPIKYAKFFEESPIHKMTFKFNDELNNEETVLSHFLSQD